MGVFSGDKTGFVTNNNTCTTAGATKGFIDIICMYVCSYMFCICMYLCMYVCMYVCIIGGAPSTGFAFCVTPVMYTRICG